MRYRIGLAVGHTYTHNCSRVSGPSGQYHDSEAIVNDIDDGPITNEADLNYESDSAGSMDSMDRGHNYSDGTESSADELSGDDLLDDDELLIMNEMYWQMT